MVFPEAKCISRGSFLVVEEQKLIDTALRDFSATADNETRTRNCADSLAKGMKPNLLVDDRWKEGGIKRFAHELVTRLDPQFAVSRLTEKWHIEHPLNPTTPIWLAWEIGKRHPDVFWNPGFMSPLSSSVPFIFTVHDLIHVRAVRGARALYFDLVLRPLCKKAYKIVTVSEFSRSEICEWAGLPPDHVVRIGNAASSHFRPEGSKFSPGYPYLLYVGVRSAHKNLPRVLNAFAKSGLAGQCKLLFSGARDSELEAIASKLHIGDSLVFAGKIPDAELPSYYRGALGLVLVSTYEGFGLTALEALACGTPVLCANTTSLPEVVGDAAFLVNPLNIEAIADGMNKIVYDSELREKLIRKGLARRSVFSWEESSRKLSSLLLEAVDAGRT
jgi:glycosyltransferase involved in cell wall biosynthesis